MSQGRGIPGNSIASQAQFEKEMGRLGAIMLRFESIADRMFEEGQLLYGCSIKFKGDGRADYLLVLRMGDGSGKYVSFHSGDSLAECIRGTVARLENGSIKWKVDEYG